VELHWQEIGLFCRDTVESCRVAMIFFPFVLWGRKPDLHVVTLDPIPGSLPVYTGSVNRIRSLFWLFYRRLGPLAKNTGLFLREISFFVETHLDAIVWH